MAFVQIIVQPTKTQVVASLSTIAFQFYETTGNTVNVVVQCWVNKWGTWKKIGGQVRCASRLYDPQRYDFNFSSIATILPHSHIGNIQGLGMGNGCFGSSFEGLQMASFKDTGDWMCKLEVQREYFDSATNTVILDPDIKESNEFYVYEAAPPISNSMYNYTAGGANQYNNFMQPYRMTDQNQSQLWLWMTDCVLRRKTMKLGNGNIRKEFIYNAHTSPLEQYYIFCYNSDLADQTQYNKLNITTHNADGGYLNTHTFDWNSAIFGGYSNAGRNYCDVGWRTLMSTLNFNAIEGSTQGDNVDHYYVWNLVGNSGQYPSTKWKFNIDRSCVKIANPLGAWTRFMWKNQMGGFDMFTVNGRVKTERKFKPSTYEKRQTVTGVAGERGKQNYQTAVEYRHKITSHEMDNLDGEWLSKMIASPQTYVRYEIDEFQNANNSVNNLTGMDAPAYTNFDIYFDNFDSSKCNGWVPIVISTKSIQISTTKENTIKLKFTYKYAVDNLFVRD